MSDDAIIAGAMSLAGVALGGIMSYAVANRLSAREDTRERHRTEREALSARLASQSAAIDKFVELVTKWETKPVVGKFIDGRLAVEVNAIAANVNAAHADGAALFSLVSAAFGRGAFTTETRLAIEMVAGMRAADDLALGAMQVAQHCLDEMTEARARTEAQLGLPKAHVPQSYLDIADQESHPRELVEKLLRKSARTPDELRSRLAAYREMQVFWGDPPPGAGVNAASTDRAKG
jgi:hypothetical protein